MVVECYGAQDELVRITVSKREPIDEHNDYDYAYRFERVDP